MVTGASGVAVIGWILHGRAGPVHPREGGSRGCCQGQRGPPGDASRDRPYRLGGWAHRGSGTMRADGREDGDVADRTRTAADAVPGGGGARRPRRRAAGGRAGGVRPGLHPRRRRHRQDPHHHPPDRLRRAHRRLRPRAGARGDLHRPGGGRAARPAGRARTSAACRRAPSTPRRMRQLRYFAPRVLGGPMPVAGREQAAAGGDGGVPRRGCPPTARACATWPARSSGRRRRSPRRTTTRPRAKAAGREPPFEAAAVAAVYASYESAKQRDGALDFEDLLLVTAYALEEHPDGRPGGARAVPALRRRRVPGRQPAAAAAARRLARRPRRPLRRRRPQPDHLLLHRRRPRLPARLRRPLSRRRRRQAGARLPLDAAGRRRWPTG